MSELFEQLVGKCAERMATEGITALNDICALVPGIGQQLFDFVDRLA